MVRKHITAIISSLLVLLYSYVAFSKLSNYRLFRFQLAKSPLFHTVAWPFALILPLTELAVAALLIIPYTRRTGLKVSLLLLSVFTVYLICILSFAPHLPCTCGGVLQQLSWKGHVVFNLCCISANIIALRSEQRQKPLLRKTRYDHKDIVGQQSGIAEHL